jgi:hypothetical protein
MRFNILETMNPPFRHPERMGREVIFQSVVLLTLVISAALFWPIGDRLGDIAAVLTMASFLLELSRGLYFWWQYRDVEVPLRPVRSSWWD